MIVFSIVAYVVLAFWYLITLGNSSNAHSRIPAALAILGSGFFAYWFQTIAALIIYFLLGSVCVFFYFITYDDANPPKKPKKKRKKMTALLLGLFFGPLGIHRFYLGKSTTGWFYLMFAWSSLRWIGNVLFGFGFYFAWNAIPVMILAIDLLVLLFTKKSTFDQKYNTVPAPKTQTETKKTDPTPTPTVTPTPVAPTPVTPPVSEVKKPVYETPSPTYDKEPMSYDDFSGNGQDNMRSGNGNQEADF